MFNAAPLVLCYHAVSNRWDAPLAVSGSAFGAQIASLARRGYRGVTFTELARNGGDGQTVAITFDDGYKSVYDLARPILEEHGFPATVFVPTALIDHAEPLTWPGIDHWAEDPTANERDPMSVDELRAVVADGWEIGSHTMTHAKLPELGDEDLRRELEVSRRQCSELTGNPCTSIAFPYGAVDHRVLQAAEKAGYEASGLLSSELVRPTRFAIERVGIYNADGPRSFRIKTSPWLRRLPDGARRRINSGARALRR